MRPYIVQVLAPLPIGFAVFMVHLATIPITGTGINPARSLGAAVIYNHDYAWDDQVGVINLICVEANFTNLDRNKIFRTQSYLMAG